MVWKIPLPGALLLEAEELPPKERRCEDSCCSGLALVCSLRGRLVALSRL